MRTIDSLGSFFTAELLWARLNVPINNNPAWSFGSAKEVSCDAMIMVIDDRDHLCCGVPAARECTQLDGVRYSCLNAQLANVADWNVCAINYVFNGCFYLIQPLIRLKFSCYDLAEIGLEFSANERIWTVQVA